LNRRVAVTGIGLVSPHGDDPAGFFAALMRGESAIRLYVSEEGPHPLAIPAARCADFDAAARLGRARANSMDRFSQIGTAAALSAWQDAGLPPGDSAGLEAAGVCWGTGAGGALTTERGYRDLYLKDRPRISPLSVILGMNNAAAAHVAIALRLGGANLTYSVACASSTVAIGEAFHRVRSGETPVMLAGGSDAPLAYGVIRAWESLQVLALGDAAAAPGVCRPFHAGRSGLVLAEGGGALILEDWQHARGRGARIYAELLGYGASCDHDHLTRPHPAGQARAIAGALRDGGLNPDQVDYVNAHGTATKEGDVAEIAALRQVLGARSEQVAISATKSMHGHLMGATGAIEAIACVLALQRQAIPPTAFLDAPDPACVGLRHVDRGETGVPLRVALSNSFAFGGSNAVLAFGAV